MIRIDLEGGTVAVDDADGEKTYPLQSPEAFSAISRAWLRCGWDTKYVYRLTRPGRPIIQLPDDMFRLQEVIYRVQPDALVATEETFGPVVPIGTVRSAQEALELTNASPFGLTTAVFTEDLERGLAFAEQSRAGWVNVNASTNLWESHLPFGGRAGSVSGRGRVGGHYPMQTFTEPKTVVYPAPRLKQDSSS